MLSVFALGVLAASAAAQVPEMDPDSTSIARPRTDRRLLVRRPLRIAHNGGFQSLVFTPPFESAEILPAGGGYTATHYQAARTDITTQGANTYRGTFHALDFSGALGITDRVGPIEAKFDLSVGRLAAADHEISATFEGAQVMPATWSSGATLRRAAVGLKIGMYDDRALELAVSVTGWAKLPIDGDEHLSDTGEAELGGVLQITHGMRVPADAEQPNLFLHAQLGGMWRQNQDVFNTRVRPNGGVVWGIGAVAVLTDLPIALVVQAEGSSNAWEDLDDFNSDPVSLSLGTRIWGESEGSTRAWYDGVLLELAISFGFGDRNGADTAVTFGIGYHF